MSRRKSQDSDIAVTEITGGDATSNAPAGSQAEVESGSLSAAEPGEADSVGTGNNPRTSAPPVTDNEPTAPVVQPPAVFANAVAVDKQLPPSPFGAPDSLIALQVSSLRPNGFRRAGRAFYAEPSVLMPWDIDQLGAVAVHAIESEKSLKTRRLTWAELSDAQRSEILARFAS